MNKLKKSRNGIIFTLDALFALMLALSFFIYISYYTIDQNQSFTDTDLLTISQDILTVLEKDGTLKKAILTNDITNIQTFIDNTPVQICLIIKLYDSIDNELYSIQKSQCTISEQNVITKRIFITQNTPYLAEMEAWYFES